MVFITFDIDFTKYLALHEIRPVPFDVLADFLHDILAKGGVFFRSFASDIILNQSTSSRDPVSVHGMTSFNF